MIACCSYRLHVIFSAYLSIVVGLVVAFLSWFAGHEETSMSLYGIAVMSFVDITGSLFVLSLWQCTDHESGDISIRKKEAKYSRFIGYMMVFLGMFLILDCTKSIFEEDSPSATTTIALIVTIIEAFGGFGLALYKYVVGKAVRSPVVVADSLTTLCSSFSSFGALIVMYLETKLWWSDSVLGFAVALYTLYSGVRTIYASQTESLRLAHGEEESPLAVKATPVSSSSYQASAGNHFPSRLFKNSSAEPDTASSDMFYEGSDVNISFLDGFLRLVGVAYHDQQQQRHEYERLPVSDAEFV